MKPMQKFIGARPDNFRGLFAVAIGDVLRMMGLAGALGLAGLLLIGALAGCRSTKKIQKVIATTNIRRDTTGDAAKAAAAAATPRDAHADSLEVIRQAVAGLGRNHIDFQTF